MADDSSFDDGNKTTTGTVPADNHANDFVHGEILFNPSNVDIVSTKIRTWNARHPGNVFYNDLVARTVANSPDMPAPLVREAAMQIYDILTVDRGGRFLKLPERVTTSHTCTLMKRSRCVEKIIHAIKTAMLKKILREKGITQPYKKEKKKDPSASTPTVAKTKPKILATKINCKALKIKKPKEKAKLSSNPSHASSNKSTQSLNKSPPKAHAGPIQGAGVIINPKKTQSSPTNSTNRLALLPFSVAYEAVAGNQPIHGYALKIISVVCSQSDPWTAFQALDVPCSGHTSDSEPERERLMRLQLRQRFASAAAAGISSVEFSRKLLQMWGGRLIEAPPIKNDVPTADSVKGNNTNLGGGDQKEMTTDGEQIQGETHLDPTVASASNEHSSTFAETGESTLSLRSAIAPQSWHETTCFDHGLSLSMETQNSFMQRPEGITGSTSEEVQLDGRQSFERNAAMVVIEQGRDTSSNTGAQSNFSVSSHEASVNEDDEL